MNALQLAAQRAVVGKLVREVAEEFCDRTALLDMMIESGAKAVEAVGPDGCTYGSVSRSNGRRSARVADPEAFFLWVLERYPEKIIRLIDPIWEKNLMTMAGRLGDPVDAGTGEVIPGVVIEHGTPYVSTRATDDGRERIRAMLDPQRGAVFALPSDRQAG